VSAVRPIRVCLLGLDALPSLSREHANLGVAAGEPVQQSLLARALAARGYDVTLIVLDQGQPEELVVDGVRTLKAYRPERGIRLVRYFHPRWSGVVRALERADADVYYTSCAGINVAQIVQVARKRGAGTIFRVASDSDCQPGKLLMPRHSRSVYRWGLERVDRVLVQTQDQQRDLRVNFGRESTVAGMLVEPGRGDLSFEQRDCHGLWVANIRQLKRPDRMLELARGLPSQRFAMIGGTQPGALPLFDEVRAAAESVPNLDFLGPVPYHDVGEHFERARVLVNTSDIEGFPNTYLQAWARGVPVVTFIDPDGVIAREGLGLVVVDDESLRRAVSNLSADPEYWASVSRRCRAYVESAYNDQAILDAYGFAIDQLASESTRGRRS
jgi:glycosyltransferase involved in cell wall biosynthesis